MNVKNGQILFGFPVEHLSYAPEPTKLIISPDDLAEYYHVNNDIVRARGLAARSIRRMRRKQRQLCIAQQQKLAEENKSQLKQLIIENQNERKKLLAETVKWLVEEQDIERQLYFSAMQKARQWTIEALQLWGIEADWDSAIYMRVKTILKQFQKEPNLVLALPSQDKANAFEQNLLADCEYSQHIFQVVVDSNLESWQATLGNSLVSVLIDMHAELDDILQQLRSQPVASTVMTAEENGQD
ncbi:TPA: hypothetical protein RU610_000609 [Salmonella enterica]|nr:hypothetical protein [Salmonella enterica]HEA0265647.1 hypothetical protein [Salmonella enterica]HEA0292152.1 hypothetical protein [Salmonella enterica]HEA0332882.1 hypothetical protein [Salmonella enterica]HEA0338235.1 hypothetical protein [Salmonella enterica]